MIPRSRFACARCHGLVEHVCPCGQTSGAWAYAEQVIMLGPLDRPDIEPKTAAGEKSAPQEGVQGA